MLVDGKSLNVNDNCFDAIRLFCAFVVFGGHFLTDFCINNNLLYGTAYFIRGVPVFFFISGYFIARSLERYDLKNFLQRRLLRIFPELWVCVLVNLVIILCVVSGGGADVFIYLATQLTVFQFYTGEWLKVYGVGVPNGALWTITVEIQFYLLAVILANKLKSCKLKTWLNIIVLTMVISLILQYTKDWYPLLVYKFFTVSIISFMWIFLIGMCIYYNREIIIPVLIKKKYQLLVLYIIWQYFLPDSFVVAFEGVRYNLITTVIMLLIVTGIGYSWSWRSLQDYSYSFYLYHIVVINFVIHNIGKYYTTEGYIMVFLSCFVAISILAIISRKYVAGALTKKIEDKFIFRKEPY